MSITESTATALVRFTGLGIICFNDDRNRSEIALIRDQHHELSINIQEPRFKDGIENDIIVYETIAGFQDLPKENVSIEISTTGNSAVRGFEIYQTEDGFDRLQSEDFNDFRWVVDMKNMHRQRLSVSETKDRYPISKLFIENGLFYVHKLDTELFFERVEKNSGGEELSKETFGNVAETIGVKLEADEVSFGIKINGQEEIINLKRRNGLPYRIEIKNMNYDEDAAMSDLPDYYRYIASPDNKEFELQAVSTGQSPAAAAGGVTGRSFCHPVMADINSIDSF